MPVLSHGSNTKRRAWISAELLTVNAVVSVHNWHNENICGDQHKQCDSRAGHHCHHRGRSCESACAGCLAWAHLGRGPDAGGQNVIIRPRYMYPHTYLVKENYLLWKKKKKKLLVLHLILGQGLMRFYFQVYWREKDQ